MHKLIFLNLASLLERPAPLIVLDNFPSLPIPPSPLIAARYYGTVFSIIETIILLGGVVAYIGYTSYKEYVSSTDRIVELRAFESQLLAANESKEENPKETEDAAHVSDEKSSFGGRVKATVGKIFRRAPRESSA